MRLKVIQGVGEGLPIMVPLAKDPRADRFLMDQLVDTGSRTVEGMAAMNGEMIRRMKVPNPERAICHHLRQRIRTSRR